MNTSVYSFNKHSFSTCVGQALGDVGVSETGPLHAGVHRWGGQGKIHIITNGALCVLCWRQALSALLGAKRKKEISLLMKESKMCR